jgi:hypothetical protein
VTGEFDVSAGGRTWRLTLTRRVLITAYLALIPLTAAGLCLPSGSPFGDGPLGPVGWGVTAAAILVWLLLARRAWRESVTLTADALVITNMFSTRRVPLAHIVGVTVGRRSVRVTEAGAATPPRGDAGAAPRAVHAGDRSWAVDALRTGGAYSTGRRVAADEIADEIAAAAGLPPLAPRKSALSRDRAWFMVIAGLASTGLGIFIDPLHVLVVGSSMLYPALPAAIDYWRNPPPAR